MKVEKYKTNFPKFYISARSFEISFSVRDLVLIGWGCPTAVLRSSGRVFGPKFDKNSYLIIIFSVLFYVKDDEMASKRVFDVLFPFAVSYFNVFFVQYSIRLMLIKWKKGNFLFIPHKNWSSLSQKSSSAIFLIKVLLTNGSSILNEMEAEHSKCGISQINSIQNLWIYSENLFHWK